MKEYHFSKEELSILENLRVPIAVYQFIDKRVVVKALSKGFCDLFDFDNFEDAYYVMNNDMYSTSHPDDASRVANAAYRFATEDAVFEVVYRVRTKKSSVYKIVHAKGEHVYLDTGERLAYVWYTDEGSYTGDDDHHMKDVRDALRAALHQESMIQTSYHDNLTGLPNMSFFLELVDAGRISIRNEGRTPAILFIDLNGMKFFNHQYGFAEGDKLLRGIANVLSRHFKNDNCSRFGQDNFAVFTDAQDLEKRVRNVIKDCAELNDGRSLPLRIGIYIEGNEIVDASTACDRAKYACDSLAGSYISEYAYFRNDMLEEIHNRQYVIDNLDRALAENWIQVYYQPIVRAANGRVCDEEALSRWIDPVRGFMSPAEFIPALEQSRLIYKLDLYVVEQVLKKMKAQADAGLYIVPQSVNLSRSDFDTCDIVEEIRRRVDEAGIERDKLNIEVTESVVGREMEFINEQVERFHELGFRVWMDDFGSGYSSLDVLQNIHFDVLKLDMGFMECFGRNEESRIILTELVRMAIGLGIDTVCEGVETAEQVGFLREIGCTMLQGFYFCKPIPMEQIVERNRKGIQIGFENPDETDYYSAIGRINLYDTAVFGSEEKDAMRNYFNTIPMAIIESTDDFFQIVRCNNTYRTFMERVFGVAEIGLKVSYEDVASHGEEGIGFLRAVQQCGVDGNRAIVDEMMPDGSTVHAIVKRVAVNPVTGTAAMAVAVLGVFDKDTKNAAVEYAQIANALSSDYFDLYYVNIETDDFMQYSSDNKYNLNSERHGTDFFETARTDAMRWLYESDRDYFVRSFNKENIVRAIDTQGAFTLTYRLMTGDSPEYVNMKAVRMKNDDRHIIFGVNSVDAQMKNKMALEQLEAERITFERISALAGNYICIYTVDPETDSYFEYSSTEDYDGLGFAKEGEDFFVTSRRNIVEVIYPEDKPIFMSVFTRENVMNEISQNGLFELQYRLMMDGVPTYVNLRAAIVQEKNGPQLIVGLNNVDARVRRDLEFMHTISVAQAHANIDPLTGVKNMFAFEEAEGQLDTEIAADHNLEFAVVVFDVKGLGEINNAYGHRAGDEFIMKACTDICTLFKHSPVYRISDDRFAAIARGMDYDNLDDLLGELDRTNTLNEQKNGIVIAYGIARYEGGGNSEEVFTKAYDSLLTGKKRTASNAGADQESGENTSHLADEDRLERARFQLVTLAKPYLSVYEIDLVNDTFVEILSKDKKVDGIIGEQIGNAGALLVNVMKEMTDESFIEEIMRFIDLSTLRERLRDRDDDSLEFISYRGVWCRAGFTVSERMPDGFVTHVIWTVELIDQAKKIESLTASLKSLLINMPAMAFSKDVETGRYLACNNLFAAFAHRNSPDEVIGLTLADIFDKETAAQFAQDDARALSMDEPYTFIAEYIDSEGTKLHMQTIKLKYTDTTGRECLLGMSVNVTEMAELRRETRRAQEAYEKAVIEGMSLSYIATALAADYNDLYLVDVVTDDYHEYRPDKHGHGLKVERSGSDFFNSSKEEALRRIYEDDQGMFLREFTKENVLSALNKNGNFTITYRLMDTGVPVYANMKITRMEGDDRQIIIGVNNVDAQMKKQEELERIRAEEITYSRVNALSGDFLCIYTVDPETGKYLEYSGSAIYDHLGISKEGDDFFGDIRRNAGRSIYLEDIEMVVSMMEQEKLLGIIRERGYFTLDYRLLIKGIPTNVKLKAAMVEEKDGEQLIVGVINVDDQVKREQEYINSLNEARNKANIDALTGVKNKHAYIDIESELNYQIEENQPVRFAIVVFDINNLKEVNDNNGHQAGDDHIKRACKMICDVFKHSPVFRVGGDEFTVIAQGQDYDNIDDLIAQLAAINEANTVYGEVVVACGMARYENDRNVGAVFERADMAMYADKRNLKR